MFPFFMLIWSGGSARGGEWEGVKKKLKIIFLFQTILYICQSNIAKI